MHQWHLDKETSRTGGGRLCLLCFSQRCGPFDVGKNKCSTHCFWGISLGEKEKVLEALHKNCGGVGVGEGLLSGDEKI